MKKSLKKLLESKYNPAEEGKCAVLKDVRKLKVKMNLEGIDGNAFFILGMFQNKARKQGFSADEIKGVMDEASSGDYDHLLQTIMLNVIEEDED